ncbi:cytochrome c [Paraglaciecola aquimarina]|uniref:Cytochrome c n=1 Tax=Paraglaciecola algarum TaxID=3050085 RepID=A0ABS9DAV9_9ALTE|nr:c-type cytochrome [Paraglaciecola sp. G1-23]MCF2950101.1 cytochrome c [Paraglaciecola sp. G1-23]
MSFIVKCLIAGLLVVNTSQLLYANGKQAYTKCIACHGEMAEGKSQLNAPALAGQFDWYLTRQINNFASGQRGSHNQDTNGKTMAVFAKSLSDKNQLDALSKYISQLPSISTKGTLSGNMMNGSRYYQAKCGACHGGNAQGNKGFNAPKLAGQSTEYLALQMANFKQDIRGYHQEDKLGRQMAMMAKVVSEQELIDILFYIAEQE